MTMSWPILYKDILRIGNLDSPVGIATMWTERDVVRKLIGNDKAYCVIGNLYSSAGISAVIRNIYAKPTIRYVLLWGADLSRSGQAFIKFMENGVDSDYKIKGFGKGGQIERAIPIKDLELFRKSVRVVNLRGKSPKELRKVVVGLTRAKPLSGAFSNPKVFPRAKPKYKTFPSEQIGFKVDGKTVAQTWLKVLLNIVRYGREKKTRYAKDNELKELLNLMAVVYGEDIDKPYLPHYFAFGEKELKQYIVQVISAKKIPGVSYTYGQRLREHRGALPVTKISSESEKEGNVHKKGIDQIAEIIELIKRRPFSKKMIAVTVDVARDWAPDSVDRGDTPCLTQILCSIQDNKLFFTGHFRSQDMVHGWPRNVLSLIKLQDIIAKQTGYARGPFCLITHSAHIYADDYKLVEDILDKYYEKELGFTPQQHFEEDPRGNVIVSVEKREIAARLYAPESEGGQLLKEWRGKTAMEIYLDMVDWSYLVMPSHLVYIGTELQRAEFAIKYGLRYDQDPGPNKAI